MSNLIWNMAEAQRLWLEEMRAQGDDPTADEVIAAFRSMSGYSDTDQGWKQF